MEEAVQESEEESDADYDTEDENEKQARLGRPGAFVASFVASHMTSTPVRVLKFDKDHIIPAFYPKLEAAKMMHLLDQQPPA